MLEVLAVTRLVEAVTQCVEHVALDAVADRYRDRGTGVGHLDAADQSVGRLHRDGAHQVVAEVLGNLEGQGLRHLLVGDLGVQGVEQFRHGTTRELDVDDRAGDADHATAVLESSAVAVIVSSLLFVPVVCRSTWHRRARWRHRRSR